jgi:hypothetical protein
MDTEDLIIKKVRIKVWEDKHEIEDLTKLRKEILEFKENFVIGEQFKLKQDNFGNFYDIDNQPLSI